MGKYRFIYKHHELKCSFLASLIGYVRHYVKAVNDELKRDGTPEFTVEIIITDRDGNVL